jgi:uncharacterized protein (TIGR03066 family)
MFNRLHRERRSRRDRRSSRGDAADPQAVAQAADTRAPLRGPRLWLALLLCLAVSSVVSFAVFKLVLVPTMPPELVGTWQVTAGPLRGATLEFRGDGSAIAILHKGGKKETTHSSARVEGKQLVLTTRDDTPGKVDVVTQTIVELTADELVLRDEDLITYHLKRVRN